MKNLSKIQMMKWALVITLTVAAIKFFAYFITRSGAVLTDALESIVNVLTGSFALFSLYYAQKPKDADHPYGHGKIEFISSGLEGGMILIAGIGMVTKGLIAFFHKEETENELIGLLLSAGAGAVNAITGMVLLKKGRMNYSSALIAEGKHLLSDTYSSIAIVLGLGLIWLTGYYVIDYLLTLLMGIYIAYEGIKVLMESINNLLDKADEAKIKHVIALLNKNRRDKWIDFHNLRILKYGSLLHVDCHMTLPCYLSLEEAHAEVDMVEAMIKQDLEQEVEFFIHADPCIPGVSCTVCTIENCKVREVTMISKINWNLENLLPDRKHKIAQFEN